MTSPTEATPWPIHHVALGCLATVDQPFSCKETVLHPHTRCPIHIQVPDDLGRGVLAGQVRRLLSDGELPAHAHVHHRMNTLPVDRPVTVEPMPAIGMGT